MLTHEEIRILYDRGPEAVIAVVEQLCVQIAALTIRVKELEDRLATTSRNSSKPPSSDGVTKQTRSLRQPSSKKPGGAARSYGDDTHPSRDPRPAAHPRTGTVCSLRHVAA